MTPNISMIRKSFFSAKPNKLRQTNNGPIARTNPCTTKHCIYCPKYNKSGRIQSTFTKRSYSSKIWVDCKSGNLIYCITCKTCKIQYVFQTKWRVMDRFQGHFYNITSKNTKDTIGQNFNASDYHGIEDLEVHIVDFIYVHPLSP